MDKASNPGNKNNSTKKLVIVLLMVIVVSAAAVLIVFMLRTKEEPVVEPENTGNVYTLDDSNFDRIMEEMDHKVAEGRFETYMTTEWVFPSGLEAASDAVFGNSPNNTKPIRCELALKDTGEVIFKSNVLPVGSQLKTIKLTKNLPKGNYEAVCYVYLMEETEGGYKDSEEPVGFDVDLRVAS